MRNLYAIIFIYLSIISCQDTNRDKLDLIDSFSQVRSNILKLDLLIKYNNRKCNNKYEIIVKNDSIVLLRSPDTSAKFVPGSFCVQNDKHLSDLDSIISIMKRSYLISAVKYKGIYMYNFNRYNLNGDFDYTKYMVVDSVGVEEKLEDVYKILDVKDGIIMAKPKRLEFY
jgi:hypothetical protein